jgi:hypothetical protein
MTQLGFLEVLQNHIDLGENSSTCTFRIWMGLVIPHIIPSFQYVLEGNHKDHSLQVPSLEEIKEPSIGRHEIMPTQLNIEGKLDQTPYPFVHGDK